MNHHKHKKEHAHSDWKQTTCGQAEHLPNGCLIWWRPNGKVSFIPETDVAIYKDRN